jgi:chemotaxis protein CheD
MHERVLIVNMGDLVVSNDPGEVLAALGLGSCVALCAYDPAGRAGAMAHVVLPSSAIARPHDGPGKFADQAVSGLVREMAARGSREQRLRIALVGGANVLKSKAADPVMEIGARNISAVREALGARRLAIAAEDVGGTTSRTVRLVVGTGEVTVRTIHSGERSLVRLGGPG